MGSVGQRAAKLLAVKVGVLKKKSAASAIPPKVCASAFGPVSGPVERGGLPGLVPVVFEILVNFTSF